VDEQFVSLLGEIDEDITKEIAQREALAQQEEEIIQALDELLRNAAANSGETADLENNEIRKELVEKRKKISDLERELDRSKHLLKFARETIWENRRTITELETQNEL
jgi:ElaB/YqjD/DUF883 family membrane-anchored ribosome-binding protein